MGSLEGILSGNGDRAIFGGVAGGVAGYFASDVIAPEEPMLSGVVRHGKTWGRRPTRIVRIQFTRPDVPESVVQDAIADIPGVRRIEQLKDPVGSQHRARFNIYTADEETQADVFRRFGGLLLSTDPDWEPKPLSQVLKYCGGI